jgi:CHAD domain-containing protein
MPKAWTAENLSPDMPLAHAAALVLDVKLPEVLHYEAAARTGKVAGIHDMRVACKRMREAWRVLRPALPPDARRRLLPAVEELNDALGQVRDRDVLRDAFKRLGRASGPWPDLQALRRSLARERRVYHRQFLRLLDRLKQSGFRRKYARLMSDLHEQPAAGQAPLAQFAAAAVGARLQEVMDNLHAITGRYRGPAFHRQRIRVKKLKYALEPFLPLLTDDTAELYAMVSDLQELMGLVHDAEVQREVLADWAGSHGLGDGLRHGLQEVARHRRELLAQTRAHVQHMGEQDFESRLQRALAQAAHAGVAQQGPA